MALLFISSLVPDTKKYHNEAFTRSGNNVLLGIATSLDKKNNPELLSFRPVPSYPKAPLWISGETAKLESGEVIKIFPTLNIKLIKNIFWNLLAILYILRWAFKYRYANRDILVYNIYIPSIASLFRVAKFTNSKLFTILYDLGVPPKRLGLGRLTMLGYKIGEKKAKKFLPKVDGRIVINENIITHYAPGKDSILIDGGINDVVIANLLPIKISQTSKFTFLLEYKSSFIYILSISLSELFFILPFAYPSTSVVFTSSIIISGIVSFISPDIVLYVFLNPTFIIQFVNIANTTINIP